MRHKGTFLATLALIGLSFGGASTPAAAAAGPNPLLQNPLVWVGTPNPNPPVPSPTPPFFAALPGPLGNFFNTIGPFGTVGTIGVFGWGLMEALGNDASGTTSGTN